MYESVIESVIMFLSYKEISQFLAELKKADIEPWYQDDEENLYEVTYPFVSLDGLNELKNILCATKNSGAPSPKIVGLSLSGHAINDRKVLHTIFETFPDILSIFLDGNRITEFDFPRLTQKQLQSCDDGNELGPFIVLRNNKITQLNDSFFEGVKQLRSYAKSMRFFLQDNPISAEQKIILNKKMYYATHTFPERYVSLKNIEFLLNPTLQEWAYLWLAGVPVGSWLFYAMRKEHWPLWPVIEAGGLVGAAMGAVSPVVACMSVLLLAKMTHPELHISPFWLDTIWAKGKPKLSLADE